MSALDRVISRLEEVVREETAALRTQAAPDLRDFNARKSHGLLELSRALRGMDRARLNAATDERLQSLRRQLEANRAALDLHLQAVREIATIVSDAIRDADSDGTYSPALRGAGARP